MFAFDRLVRAMQGNKQGKTNPQSYSRGGLTADVRVPKQFQPEEPSERREGD